MKFLLTIFLHFQFLYFIANSTTISSIPSTGIPPSQRFLVSAVYDELENRIITYGGYDDQNGYVSDLYAFYLNSSTWSEIPFESSTIPEGPKSSYMYLRSDRTLLVFFGMKFSGISSDIYGFDLVTYRWKEEFLSGDKITGRNDFGATSFINDQNATIIAIFGGITYNGPSNELFL